MNRKIFTKQLKEDTKQIKAIDKKIKITPTQWATYENVVQLLKEAKEIGQEIPENSMKSLGSLAVTRGKTPALAVSWDMDKITADYPEINKKQYGKTSQRSASVKVIYQHE